MQVESTQLFKVADVASMFAVSRATVYRLVESGDLPALRFGTGKGALRIAGEAINAYLAQAATPEHPTSEAAAAGRSRRIVCAHADQNGAGMHVLAPGEQCPQAARPMSAEIVNAGV